MPDQSLEAILDYTLQSGINSIELMGDAVERYAGLPQLVISDEQRKLMRIPQSDLSDEQREQREQLRKQREQNNIDQRQWRTTVSMDKFKEIKKMFDDKGVSIHILKLGDARWSDEEIDYAFNVCKTLGAKGITMEISEEAAKRMAPFADKHDLYVIFHNHGQPENPDFSFDKPLEYGSRLMLNFDVGHYFAATGQNPCDLIKRLHERIFSIHLKDRTWEGSYDKSKNLPLGEGQTPVAEILQLIQKEKRPVYCDIELEYKIPEGSDAVEEVVKCVEYCRKALVK
jgi:sugar phosphate isomerase/epimerase